MPWTVVVATQLMLLLMTVEGQGRPEVTLALGGIRGTHEVTAQGSKFLAFKGVPFAKPPVLHRRFKEAEPLDPWPGVWEANRRRSACLQYTILYPEDPPEPINGDEDCLFLNIYTPQIPTSEMSENSSLLPVLVFIHGGAFQFGSGSREGPDRVMDRKMVFVTTNYRLGILGFLSTGDSVLPGNLGLKDQVVALRWIKDNIAAFGGNPENVTIMGLASGGACVQYHMMSPLSKGLFQRGISMSGTALSPWAKMEAAKEKAFLLGERLGCEAATSEELVTCLRSRPAFQIVDTTRVFQDFIYSPFAPFGPVVEPAGNGSFLCKDPLENLMEAAVQDIPWLVGITTAEGLYPGALYVSDPAILPRLDENFLKYFPLIMHYNYTVAPPILDETTERIRTYYAGDKALVNAFPELVQMIGDWMFVLPTVRASKLQARVNKCPVWLYSYNYRAEFSLSDRVSGTKNNYGVSHADDLILVLNTSFSVLRRQEDKNMAGFLLDVIETFMNTGNPNGPFLKEPWIAEDTNTEFSQFLKINSSTQVEMMRDDNLGKFVFWNSVPDRRAIPIIGGNLQCKKIIC